MGVPKSPWRSSVNEPSRWETLPADRMRPRAPLEATNAARRATGELVDDPARCRSLVRRVCRKRAVWQRDLCRRVRAATCPWRGRDRPSPTVSRSRSRTPRRRLGERPFRRVVRRHDDLDFGDAVERIALAFAVLALAWRGVAGDSSAAFRRRRTAVITLVVVAGGVRARSVAQRRPRRLVARPGRISGRHRCADPDRHRLRVVARGVAGVYGAGNGLVIPAEVGLVPQTVRDERPPAGERAPGALTRNLVGGSRPGARRRLRRCGEPGRSRSPIDAVHVLRLRAALSRGIRIAGSRPAGEGAGFVSELREGWQRVHRVARGSGRRCSFFGIGNFVFAGLDRARPGDRRCRARRGRPWAAILTAAGVGAIFGSLVAIRVRPSAGHSSRCVLAAVPERSLLASVIVRGRFPPLLETCAAVPVIGCARHVRSRGAACRSTSTLWFTVFQREIPERVQSRVRSYDTLGSFVLIPVGVAIVGPVADAIGIADDVCGSRSA